MGDSTPRPPERNVRVRHLDGRQLFAARDRMGEKPLYYTRSGGAFYFASEIKSLLTQVSGPPSIPPDFLVFENTLSDDTLFAGVSRLPRLISSLSAMAGRPCIGTGRPLIASTTESLRRPPSSSCRDLLVDAVQIRLQADVPVGMYLSRGLDSSLIACIAKPGVVFTSYYEYPGKFDERPPARRVAAHIGAEQIFTTAQPAEAPALLEEIAYHIDQPIAASLLSSFILARAARSRVKVVLNGQGADELFGGYVRHMLLNHEAELSQDPLFVQYTAVARRLWHPSMFGEPALRYLQMNQRVPPQTSRPLELVRQCFARHRDLVAQMGWADVTITLPDLITMDDRGCAHVGLESRSPFLDHRIVEFAFRLPGRMKIREGGVTKWILREVAREFLPADLVDRRDKMGMVSPLPLWLQRELRGWSQELVELLRRRQLEIPMETPEDNHYDRRLNALVSLELWFRTFHDRGTSAKQ